MQKTITGPVSVADPELERLRERFRRNSGKGVVIGTETHLPDGTIERREATMSLDELRAAQQEADAKRKALAEARRSGDLQRTLALARAYQDWHQERRKRETGALVVLRPAKASPAVPRPTVTGEAASRPREHKPKGGRGARAPDDPDPDPELEPAALASRACVFCGRVFAPKMPHQKRCSREECRRARNAAKMAASRARRRPSLEEIAEKAIEQLVDAGDLTLPEALDLHERGRDVVAEEAARRHASGKPVPAVVKAALARAA